VPDAHVVEGAEVIPDVVMAPEPASVHDDHIVDVAEVIPEVVMAPPPLAPGSPLDADISTSQETAGRSLLSDPMYKRFWISRVLSQTAQGALIYALLILVVDRTDATLYTSLFVACSIVPSLVFGLPAGVAVDALPRRPVLVGLNAMRFLFVVALIVSDASLIGIFAATLGIWTIHQFYAPAESAMMAGIVHAERYVSAQALSNLALTIAQALGMIVIAPVLLKTGGSTALFSVCAVLFIAALVTTTTLPSVHDAPVISQPNRRPREVLLTGWKITRRDPAMLEVLVADVLVGIGVSALVVIVPVYLKGVLGTGAENTVFVFAPAAIGLLIGLRSAPRLSRKLQPTLMATAGLAMFAITIAVIGFAAPIHRFFTAYHLMPTNAIADLFRVPPIVLLVMLLSIPGGFASSIVAVAARSVLLARAPASTRGQVIATQSLMQNAGALLPAFFAGAAADLVGVQWVTLFLAVTLIAGAAAGLRFIRDLPAPIDDLPPGHTAGA
jgi:MFS family permease